MAPRGKEVQSLLAPMSPSSRLQDYAPHMQDLSFDDVEPILKDQVADDSKHSELLQKKVRRKTEKLNAKIEKIDSYSATVSACSLSGIDTTAALILDQVASLLENGDAEEASVKTVVATTNKSIKFVDTRENAVSQPPNENFETRLQKLLESQAGPRLSSCWSSPLAFEFHTGAFDIKWLCSDSQGSLPLTVSAEPIIYARAADMLAERNNPINDCYTSCAVKVEYCSHRRYLPCSSESPLIGEATIRVYVTPGPLSRSKKIPVWGRDNDVKKMRVVEARAIQQNASPNMPQTNNPDLFVSSTYGESGLSVTMKVPTYHTSDDQAPYIHIQLVLEPPMPDP